MEKIYTNGAKNWMMVPQTIGVLTPGKFHIARLMLGEIQVQKRFNQNIKCWIMLTFHPTRRTYLMSYSVIWQNGSAEKHCCWCCIALFLVTSGFDTDPTKYHNTDSVRVCTSWIHIFLLLQVLKHQSTFLGQNLK